MSERPDRCSARSSLTRLIGPHGDGRLVTREVCPSDGPRSIAS